MPQQLQKIPAIFEKSNLFNMFQTLYIVPLPSYYLKPFIRSHSFIKSNSLYSAHRLEKSRPLSAI